MLGESLWADGRSGGVPALVMPCRQGLLAQHIVDEGVLLLQSLPQGRVIDRLSFLILVGNVVQEEAEVVLAEVRVVAREQQERVPFLPSPAGAPFAAGPA